ncbi:MAG: AMP-binding protein [Candidatus Sedimenticola endophacoides]
MNNRTSDIISLEEAGTLAGAFRERVRRSPDRTAYLQHDGESGWCRYSWRETAGMAAAYQAALRAEGLEAGDRIAILCANRLEWVLFDQAALGMGLVTVPLYTNDRAENIAYILANAGVRLLVVENREQWLALSAIDRELTRLARIISIEPVGEDRGCPLSNSGSG